MAITDSQKVDYLFKKVGYSVAKTDTSSVKSPSNESIASPLVIRGGSIWTNSDNIPTTIPTSNSSVVVLYNDSLSSTVQTANDGTASANRTWLTNLTDWVDASFGSTYQVKVYLDTTGSTTAQTTGTQLFADGTGSDEWFFDYASGVLNFIGTSLPSVSFTGKSIFISGARYIGNKGLGNLGNVTFNGAITADSVTVAGYPVLTTNSNIAINGDVVGYGTNSNVYVGLTTTGVTAGTYGSSGTIPQIVVDDKGRVTYAANLAISSTIGNLTVSDTTISSGTGMTFSASNGNIILDAQGTGVVQIIGSDAIGLPAGDTASRPGYPEIGYTRFNTEAGSIEYWDGTDWAVPGFSTVTSETINPDGSANTFVLSSNTTTYGVFVSINGTVQQPVTAYNVHDDNQITFTEVPHDTDVIEVRHFAAGVTVTALQYGNTKVQATATDVEITGNLVPVANVTYDLGSPTHWWKDLYLSGNSIYLGGMAITNNNGVLTSTVNGAPTKLQADDPVDTHDVVTLGYLQTQLSGLDNTVIQSDDTSIHIIDSGSSAGNIVIAVDGSNIATIGANAVSITRTVEVNGNISANNFNYANGVSILDAVFSNAAVQAGAIADLTANAAVQSGAIVTANTAMKGYVDAINSTLTANASLQAGNISTIQSTYAQLAGATFSGAISAPSLTLSTTALPITSGGTGGASASEALNNLFPSGETSGYVLKTSGPGSYYWSAETGSGGTVGTTISTSRTYKTATSGQTVFTGLGTYTPGAGQLRIYLNGVRQFDSAYTETNSSAVTLSSGVSSGTILLAEVDGYTDFTSYASDVVFSNVGGIAATNVQDALAELDTEKAALSGATFTGNITAGNVTATNLTGTIRTAAQTSITSIGTLGALSVTGNITAGNVSATNLSGAITSSQVTTALGFTPYNSTNPSGYISAVPNASTQVSSLGVGTAASGTGGEIRATNNITAYYSSDARLKENVRDIPNALDKVTAIGGKLFAWTDDYIASHGGVDAYFLPKESFGVVAQDVEQVFPEAVRTRDDGYLAVDYEKMCALAFQAIKELQQQVQLLEQQIKDK